jgi:hypothetical protein
MPDKPLTKFTDDELEQTLLSAAEQIGGVDKLSTGPKFTSQPFSPASGGESRNGTSLLNEYARRTWAKENPDKKSVPTTGEIFGVKGYSKKETIDRFKAAHGGSVRERKSQERSPISLQNMPDKPLTDFTDAELEQSLLSAAGQLGGIDKLSAGKSFMEQPFSPASGGESRHGRTLLNEYARRLWIEDPPNEKLAPAAQEIFKQEGYNQKEVLNRFRAAHGGTIRERITEERAPIVLPKMPDKPLTDFTDAEIEQTLLSAAEKLGGIDKLSAGKRFMSQPFSPTSDGESRTGRTLVIEYARRLWIEDHPNEKLAPAAQEIFKQGGYNQKEVLNRFRAAHGGTIRERKTEERALIVLPKMPDKPLTDFTDAEIEQTLLSAAEKLGGIDKLSTSPKFTSQPFSPASGGRSRTGVTLLSEYARRLWIEAHPNEKTVPTLGEIFNVKGYSTKEAINRFKAAHGGTIREREANKRTPIVLPKMPDKPLTELTDQELEQTLLDAAKKLGGIDKLSTGDSLMKQPFTPTSGGNSRSGETLLYQYAIRTWVKKNPSVTPVPTIKEIRKKKGFSLKEILNDLKATLRKLKTSDSE